MVELEPVDYNCILQWFEKMWGKVRPEDMPLQDRRTFWKLSFLCEDKLNEIRDDLKESVDD